MSNLKKSLRTLRFKELFSLSIASGGFVGFLPVCPGTFGALEGAVIFWFFKDFPLLNQTFLTICLSILGILTASWSKPLFNKEDPDEIVIDEIAGMWFSLIGKTNLWEFILGFVLFRVIDITKPFPLKRLESLPSGTGIMADDIAGGILTNALLIVIKLFKPV